MHPLLAALPDPSTRVRLLKGCRQGAPGSNALRTSKSNTVKRTDLANAVYREIGLSKSESSELVNSIFTKIEQELVTEGIVKLSGFGTFVTRLKSERTGRNPKTGQPVMISPRRVVTFKPSLKLTERVDRASSQRSQKTETPSTRFKWRQTRHG